MGDGVVEVADLVHKTDFLCSKPCPNPATRNLIHLLRGHPPAVGHEGDEVVIYVCDRFIERRKLHFVEGRVEAHSCVAVGAHLIVPESHGFFEEFLGVGNHAEDPDGAGDGGRGGENFICCSADVVAAGSGVIAHADNKGLACVLEELCFAPNHITRQRRSPRAVDAHDHSFDVFGEAGPANRASNGL